MLNISDKINTGSAIDTSGGGGSTINNEDLTITANGIYTASEGYTGIGTATVNVPAGSDQKYGATINNFLGDINVNGEIQMPIGNLDLVFSGLKDVKTNALTGAFSYDVNYKIGNENAVKSVSFPDLTKISAKNGLYKTFYGQSFLQSASFPELLTISSNQNGLSDTFALTAITSLSFPKLKEITSLYSAMSGICSNCTNLSSISFPNLLNANQSCFYNAFYNTALTSVTFEKLNDVSKSAFQAAFRNCTNLTSVSFPALKSTSFSVYTNQFSNMLQGVTGCTVHFPSNLQAVIGSWSDVTNGFGGTNTTVLFDLPATE